MHRSLLVIAAAGLAGGLLATSALAQQPLKGNPEAARLKISMCTGCHGIPGYRVAYPHVYHVPKIAGQQEGYIVSALHEYKRGTRNFPTMRGIASSLSDQDIADLAAFYSGSAK